MYVTNAMLSNAFNNLNLNISIFFPHTYFFHIISSLFHFFIYSKDANNFDDSLSMPPRLQRTVIDSLDVCGRHITSTKDKKNVSNHTQGVPTTVYNGEYQPSNTHFQDNTMNNYSYNHSIASSNSVACHVVDGMMGEVDQPIHYNHHDGMSDTHVYQNNPIQPNPTLESENLFASTFRTYSGYR